MNTESHGIDRKPIMLTEYPAMNKRGIIHSWHVGGKGGEMSGKRKSY